jgi:hypothetical protein
MARVEQAAQIAFAQDVGTGRAKLTSGPTASTSAPAPSIGTFKSIYQLFDRQVRIR